MADLIHVLDPNVDVMFSRDEVLASGGLDALGYFPDLDLLASNRDAMVFWPDLDHKTDSLGHGYVFGATEVDVHR